MTNQIPRYHSSYIMGFILFLAVGAIYIIHGLLSESQEAITRAAEAHRHYVIHRCYISGDFNEADFYCRSEMRRMQE